MVRAINAARLSPEISDVGVVAGGIQKCVLIQLRLLKSVANVIITFYSYKGGVGRSMALANVAVLLARVGMRVLVVDADLEAPGVGDFLVTGVSAESLSGDKSLAQRKVSSLRKALTGRDGLIDMLSTFKKDDPPKLENFIVTLNPSMEKENEWSFEDFPGSVSIIPSGNRLVERGQRYSRRVASFGYDLEKTRPFFSWFRNELTKTADVVLIDSRTGFSEMGGLVTQLLADMVVAFCAPNRQNLVGTKTVVQSFLNDSLEPEREKFFAKQDVRSRIGPLDVMVVPARIDQNAAGGKYGVFARNLESIFKSEVESFFTEDINLQQSYFKILTHNPIPYLSGYAFLEKLTAPLPSHRHSSEIFEPSPLSQAYQVLTEELVDWMLARMQFDESEMKKNEGLPLTHILSSAPEDIFKARTLQCAVESALDTWFVSLGLFDSYFKSNEKELRDRLICSFYSREAVPIIELVDSNRDFPVARWSTANLARRFWKRLGKQDSPTVRVEINKPLGRPGNLKWLDNGSVTDIAIEIDRKFPKKYVAKPKPEPKNSDEADNINYGNTRGRIRQWWNSLKETDGKVAYTVTLNGVSLVAGASISFKLSTTSGAAAEGKDFTSLIATNLTSDLRFITAAVADGVINVTVTNDSGSTLVSGSNLVQFVLPRGDNAIGKRLESFPVTLISTKATVAIGTGKTIITDSDTVRMNQSSVEFDSLCKGLIERNKTIVELYHAMLILGTGNPEDALAYFDVSRIMGSKKNNIDYQIQGPRVSPPMTFTFEDQCCDFIEKFLSEGKDREANLMLLHLFHAVERPKEEVVERIKEQVQKHTNWGGVVPLVSFFLVKSEFDKVDEICEIISSWDKKYFYFHCKAISEQVRGDHEKACEYFDQIDLKDLKPEDSFFIRISHITSRIAFANDTTARRRLQVEFNDKPFLDFTGRYNDICYYSVLEDYDNALVALNECLQSPTQLWPEWMEIDPDLQNLRNHKPEEFKNALKLASAWRQFLR